MYHSRTYSLEPWLSKKNISSRVMLYLSVKTVVNLKHWLCECKPTSFQITVSKTEKLPVNILRKTKMEQNNEIKHIFYSKYTVSWNWFAQRRKQKVSWRTSDYHGKQERREMEVLTAFKANAAVQVFCQWHVKPWLPTQSSAAVKFSNTLSLGFIHISYLF